MSHTKNSSVPAAADSQSQSRRPFDAVMVTLSAALLVIFGIVIGRFVVTSQAVEVVDHFDAELSTLRAELVEINRQLIQSQARETALEESSARYRELATAQQIRADRLAARQQTINTLVSGLAGQRNDCLGEVQQYVALNQPVPAIDVLRFAEAMFEAQSAMLSQLNGGSEVDAGIMAAGIPRLPGFQQAARTEPTPTPAAATRPALPAPATASQIATSRHPQQGVFFDPPQRRQLPPGNIYFPPQRSPQLLTLPGKSGIIFHDTAAKETDSVRR